MSARVVTWSMVLELVMEIEAYLSLMGGTVEERNRFITLKERVGGAVKEETDLRDAEGKLHLPQLTYQLGEKATAAYDELLAAFPRRM